MKKIDGIAKSVSEILKGNKYSIDYYQREYKWESKQLQELVNDLASKFEEAWEPTHEREQVEKYPHYFLGSIIISEKDSVPYIVDGQQRLTTLTLLLTFLRRLQQGRDDEVLIDDLILSVKYGKKSFNLNVKDREKCMSALFEHGTFDLDDSTSESVKTLVARYNDLADLFPEDLRDNALPFFIDWVQHRVQIVQITAYTDDDAYAIFETMNDRGLKLTPADMLKGYLLANIADGEPRVKANDLWRKRLQGLAERDKDADSDFLKTWLRSQYARRIRERKKAAKPEDWDRIGTEFHRWLRGEASRIGLNKTAKYLDFVLTDFDFYSRQYLRILDAASWRFTSPGLEFIGYNADQGFTLQHQLLLAPLRPHDPSGVVDIKLELVARYVDILLAWRIWNYRSIAYSTMQYAMFIVMRDIRGLEMDELAHRLHVSLQRESETFDSNDRLRVHQQNRHQLHRLLARITDYIGVQSGEAPKYRELTNNNKVRYEVEHIWANRPEQHTDEFPHAYEFGEHRNLIGDLLLLPKSFNASYGDDTYEQKLPHYLSQNLLARSLHLQCYEKNPGFMQFLKSTDLPFRPYGSFKAADVVERGNLYREIAKRIWDPNDLLDIAKRAH
ncbi:DUF262 domain-containing protein [Microtetraspora sp. AC03309]|uniref:DUF262 domain-containing protein n=1 Tax=Microtetraspora sp. AC03309 TaxID=2779376 RepID=UPI001E3C47F3|nr:DUF262 domain-containing protein [Microtetraspora sp. AC03309]MCC5580531.1 DUF262 domain-containing protein [Microtetraspora sp. AC03309]